VRRLASTHTWYITTVLCSAGTLQFVKFETARMEEVLSFIESDGLLRPTGSSDGDGSDSSVKEDGTAAADAQDDGSDKRGSHSSARVLATGGGAFKFATQFQVHALSCLHCWWLRRTTVALTRSFADMRCSTCCAGPVCW
jgi:hypothetical protein